MTGNQHSKREANRRRVRRELAAAAVRLFDEQGFDATTADQIADAAHVSRRTVFRHFATKADIIFHDHDDRIAGLEAALRDSGGGEPPLDVVTGAAAAILPTFTEPADFFFTRHRVLKATPELRYREQAYGLRYTRAVARYLHARLARHPDSAVLGDMIAGAVVALVNRAQYAWASTGGDVDPDAMVRAGGQMVKSAFEPLLGSHATTTSPTVIVVSRDDVGADTVERLRRVLDAS